MKRLGNLEETGVKSVKEKWKMLRDTENRIKKIKGGKKVTNEGCSLHCLCGETLGIKNPME